LEDAISRELKEETGYEFNSYQYLGKTSANPSTHNNWMHFFLATGGKKISSQALDENEEIEFWRLVNSSERTELFKKIVTP
jgi:8-oxo-dGTP pyrophosphatase MutT (NUDIX family)